MINNNYSNSIPKFSSLEHKLSRKSAAIVTLSLIIALFAFMTACHDNNSSDGSAAALTERDFANDPNLFANPDKGVVVSFLEPGDAPELDNLTGGLGFDIIPYKYTRTLNHTYCFTDNDDTSEHSITLLNSDGEEVLTVEANGGCVEEVIEAGNYEMLIQHGEHVDKIDAIFIQPQEKEDGLAKDFKNGGMLNKLAGYLVAVLPKLDLVKPSHAQDEEADDNVTTLISTNSCASCEMEFVDLSGTDLTNAILTDADLFKADLSEAILSGADLSGADLVGATLFLTKLSGADLSGVKSGDAVMRGADLSSANISDAQLFDIDFTDSTLNSADLSGSDCTGSDFTRADLTDATVTNTDFQGVKFIDANLTGVDFTGLNVSGADFTGATYTDGECICGDAFCGNCK